MLPQRRALPAALFSLRQILPGVTLAAILAICARLVAEQTASGIAGIPQLPLSPVLCAVLLGMLWRNVVGVPAWALPGLHWTMRTLLGMGIALVGLRLTLTGASDVAATALPVAIVCISAALVAGTFVARVLKVPKTLAVLLAVGTSVCGCTAVIALAPVLRARNVDTAFAIACVVLFGCIAMLCYPWVAGYFFASSPVHAGVFLGTAIHDTSQVVGSALIYSQQAHAPEALAAASVTKLLRNLSMAVLIPAAAWWMQKQKTVQDAPEEAIKRPRIVPSFVIAFLVFVVMRTAGDAAFLTSGTEAMWQSLVGTGRFLSELLLICALAAVGLSVSFSQLWQVGWRPLAAGFALATTVGACSLALTLLLQRLL